MTYRRVVKLYKKLNSPQYIHYLQKKQDFNQYFSDFIYRDWLYLKESSIYDFNDFISKHDVFLVKPVAGIEGRGIRKIVMEGGINKDDVEALYESLIKENVMIEELIIQHPKMCFGNASVNTIRTYTVLDNKGNGHVVKAILRVGVGESVVDNYCQGGYIYEVDINTGFICSLGMSKTNNRCIVHPGTNITMLGYQIPMWNTVIEKSIQAAEHLPQIRFIGWDVAITKNGVEFIEGNHNPTYEFLEFIGSTSYYSKICTMI